MNAPPRLVWLFDVDGTLLLTDGAARESFAVALRHRFGLEDDLRDIAFAGRTEPLILCDILDKHGRTMDLEDEARFWNEVFTHMRAALAPGRGRLLTGVPEMLEAVDREPAWVMGLLTGNMTQMARIKLGRFGIAGRFTFGAFGEQAPDRDALAMVAVARARERYGVPAHRCIVVGDTEHDITCARAAGARVVAVASGFRTSAELAAREPDLLLDDLADPAVCLRWARAVAAED